MSATFIGRLARSGLIQHLLFLFALLGIWPSAGEAEEGRDFSNKDAVVAMQQWLGEIDAGEYTKSWSDAADSFRKALTSEQWVSALSSVRKPLGKLNTRKLASSLSQTDISTGNSILKGVFVIAQFDTSFDNLKYARETVTFQKETDGSWCAAGYFIKPR